MTPVGRGSEKGFWLKHRPFNNRPREHFQKAYNMGNTGNQSIDVVATNSSQGGMHTEAASGSRSDAGNISAGVDAKLEAYLRSIPHGPEKWSTGP